MIEPSGPSPGVTKTAAELAARPREHRRRILSNRPRQLRATVMIAGVVLVLLVFLNLALLTSSFNRTNQVMAESLEKGKIVQAQQRVRIFLVALASVILLAGVIVISLLETHRTAGAAFNLERSLEAIENGSYATEANFRRGDNLEDLQQAFNNMSSALLARAQDDARFLEDLAEQIERIDAPETRAAASDLKRLAGDKRRSAS